MVIVISPNCMLFFVQFPSSICTLFGAQVPYLGQIEGVNFKFSVLVLHFCFNLFFGLPSIVFMFVLKFIYCDHLFDNAAAIKGLQKEKSLI